MDRAEQGQVSREAAEIYEAFFVPALFREPAQRLVRSAAIGCGQRILDVACGTGVVAREAASAAGDPTSVTGLDNNDGMLAVASKVEPRIDWQLGSAEALPFHDQQYDRVLCQFGLMFFENRTAALREMMRVSRAGGHVLVAVWDSLERSPGYAAMVDLLRRLFGQRAADALRAPFALGEPDALRGTFGKAGITDIRLARIDVTARFPSLEAWVRTDVRGWTLSDMIDENQCGTLLQAARRELAVFQQDDGSVAFPSPARLVQVTLE